MTHLTGTNRDKVKAGRARALFYFNMGTLNSIAITPIKDCFTSALLTTQQIKGKHSMISTVRSDTFIEND